MKIILVSRSYTRSTYGRGNGRPYRRTDDARVIGPNVHGNVHTEGGLA